MIFYDFTAKDINGNQVQMADFRDQVVLIVNTASKCGLTPQFEALEDLYKKYKDQGFVVLGFPCGQFAGQELETSDDIAGFCQLNYGVTFPMFEKIKVNGKDAHPLYKFLKDEQPGTLGSKIKWNFTKFLVDRKGQVIDRFTPTTKPEDIEKNIKELLED